MRIRGPISSTEHTISAASYNSQTSLILLNQYRAHLGGIHRVPTVMEKPGKNLVMKMGKKNKVKEILKKSWNFFTADHESRTRSSNNSTSTGLLQWFGYGRLSVYVLDSQFVKVGGKPSFWLLIFCLKRDLTFFSCMWWIRAIIFCVCLPGIVENGVNCHGKSWKSHGILLSDFCGNPVYNVRVGTIHRYIAILVTRFVCNTLGNNCYFFFFFFLNAAGLGHALQKMMCLLAVRRGIDANARSTWIPVDGFW